MPHKESKQRPWRAGDQVELEIGTGTVIGRVAGARRVQNRWLVRIKYRDAQGLQETERWAETLRKPTPPWEPSVSDEVRLLRSPSDPSGMPARVSAKTRLAGRWVYQLLLEDGKFLYAYGDELRPAPATENLAPKPTWGAPAAWPTFGHPLGRGDAVTYHDGTSWTPARVESVQLVDGVPWYLVSFTKDYKPSSAWVLERSLRAPRENPSRARKRLGKRAAAGKLTTTKGTRQFCMRCERFVGRSGKPVGRRLPKPKQVLAESHGYCRPCGEIVKREMRAEIERARAAQPPAVNPDGDRERALELAESFHDQDPRIRSKKIQIHWPRRSVVYLGPCARIDYISSKFDGKRRRYFHEFQDCQLYAAACPQPGGRSLLFLTGKFKIKPEGLTG